jgi:predicted permease
VNYAQLLFPDFSLILCGYLVCRYTALNRTVWQQVESLVYFFLFPVLLFHAIVKNPLDLHATSSLIAGGWAMGFSGIAMAYAIPYLPGLRGHVDLRKHAAGAQVAFRFNSFMGLALADKLGGAAGLQLFAVLVGVCVPVFNIASVWPMARHGQRGFVKELVRNPLIIATGAGLVCSFSGLAIPSWLDPTLTRVGGASIPLGLLAAGAGFRLDALARAKLLTVALLSVRHLALPLVAWGLCRLLQLPPAQATVLMVFSALPTASSGYVLAARMGYDGAYVACLITLSTLAGVLSLPLALGVLR